MRFKIGVKPDSTDKYKQRNQRQSKVFINQNNQYKIKVFLSIERIREIGSLY